MQQIRLSVNVTLVKENDVISDNSKNTDVFDYFFNNNFFFYSGDILCEVNKIKERALKAIEKCKKHSHIKTIVKCVSKMSVSF